VKALLMGGQACILYGAVEFTRDVDFAVAVGPGNLDRLRAALDELEAEPVFFPLLSAAVLRRGHACHFRSRAAGLHGLRIDVMSKMRGVDSLSVLAAGMSKLRAATRSGPQPPRPGSARPPACSARGDRRRPGTGGRAAQEGRGPRAAAGPALLLRTKIRRSKGSGDLPFRLTRKQLALNDHQLHDAITCTLERDGYVEILRAKGLL
jgi:hypothetical protein